jgi:hypothetical protein
MEGKWVEISWEAVDFAEEPGDYMVAGVLITVTLKNIEVWREHPSAIFKVQDRTPMTGRRQNLLTSWEVEDDD